MQSRLFLSLLIVFRFDPFPKHEFTDTDIQYLTQWLDQTDVRE